MSEENIVAFLTMAKENKELFLKVQNVKSIEEFLKLANDAGYEVTAADFQEFVEESVKILSGDKKPLAEG